MPVSASQDPIRHVVVLMLENRSFDHMLGDLRRVYPEVDGIDRAKLRANEDPGKPPIKQRDDAAAAFGKQVDIGHEPENVAAQIDRGGQPMSGFVRDFRGGTLGADDGTAQQVMAYFPLGASAKNDSLPALHGLARAFTVCDRWFSSVPGPTWPNRFFLLTGTSGGWAHMPQAPGQYDPPYIYDQETIFGRLADAGLKGRVYHAGISNVLLLSKMWFHPSRFAGLDDFFEDAARAEADFPHFSFLEPDFFGKDASDQHPPHHVLRGDALVAQVYNALRANEALWHSTLLVVLHDEHGGFYDHVLPPAAVPPGDPPQDGFGFDTLGVRVPAVLASPWLERRVCSTVFDHTSVLRYVCDKWNLAPLGRRVAQANSLAAAFGPMAAARKDTPAALVESQVPAAAKSRALALEQANPNGLQEALLTAYERYLPMKLALEAGAKPSAATRALLRASPRPGKSLAARRDAAAARAATMRDLLLPSTRPLKVLAVHGISHGDLHTEWQAPWREAVMAQVRRRPEWAERDVEIVFATYDNLFENYELGPAQIAEAILRLSGGLVSGTLGADKRGIFDAFHKLDERVRWTAGMVIQWVDEPKLREELRARIEAQFNDVGPDVIAAHSLGSLICYDLFRRKVAAGAGAELDGRFLFTFGSQIANPAVRPVFDGRIEPLRGIDGHGFAHWFHFFNPHDHVFTKPLPLSDDFTTNLVTEFDAPGIANHAGELYLGHAGTRPAWEAVTDRVGGTRSLATTTATATAAAHRARAKPVALEATRRTRPAKHRALVVGINEYPDPRNRLEGCVNDAFLMSSVLQEQGVDADDIRLVLDRRATRAGVMERLDWLVDGARDGDLRVLFYSGHGAQIPTYDEKAEPDGDDETLVLYDFDWSRDTAFTDKDFRKYYSELPYGVHLLGIFDCCHSGGMTRNGSRTRGISPPDDIRHRGLRWNATHQMWVPRDFDEARGRASRLYARPPAAAHKRAGLRSFGQCDDLRAAAVPPAGTRKRTLSARTMSTAARKDYGHKGPFMPLLMYACGETELASEYVHGSVSYGAFTYVLTKLFRKANQKPTTATLNHLIVGARAELHRLQYEQTPEFVGPAAKYSDRTRLTDLKLGGKDKPK